MPIVMTSRVFPLMLLAVMVTVGVMIELFWSPPLMLEVKLPLICLLAVGLGLRRIDRRMGKG